MLYLFFALAKHWFLSDSPKQNTMPAVQHKPIPGGISNALKKPPLVQDYSVTSFPSSLDLLFYSYYKTYIPNPIFALSPATLSQFFHPKAAEPSFLYLSNYTLTFHVYCILCWIKTSSLWDPCTCYPVLHTAEWMLSPFYPFSGTSPTGQKECNPFSVILYPVVQKQTPPWEYKYFILIIWNMHYC